MQQVHSRWCAITVCLRENLQPVHIVALTLNWGSWAGSDGWGLAVRITIAQKVGQLGTNLPFSMKAYAFWQVLNLNFHLLAHNFPKKIKTSSRHTLYSMGEGAPTPPIWANPCYLVSHAAQSAMLARQGNTHNLPKITWTVVILLSLV